MRRGTWISLAIGGVLLTGLVAALLLKAKAPPEAARLLPESDAIVYAELHPLETAARFSDTPVARSADFQRFVDATGIVPERDLDAVAMAFHRMPDPHGPNGPVAYSEVFVGHFDSGRLAGYLHHLAASEEVYATHTIYSLAVEGRTLRVTQLSYDTVGASNTPTLEAIHSMIDRERTGGLWRPGSSLLAARFGNVPLLSQAWGVGHIGLPFSQNGHVSLLGLELPVPADTDFVASLRYAGTVKLRIEEIAPSPQAAERTVRSLSTLLDLTRGLDAAEAPGTPQAAAMHAVLAGTTLERRANRAVLSASATPDQLRALAAAAPSARPTETPSP